MTDETEGEGGGGSERSRGKVPHEQVHPSDA